MTTDRTTAKEARPRARAIRKSDSEYARWMKEQAVTEAANSALSAEGEAFKAALNTALDSFETSEVPAALADAMRQYGPAVTLAAFDKLFPQFDLAVSLKSE